MGRVFLYGTPGLVNEVALAIVCSLWHSRNLSVPIFPVFRYRYFRYRTSTVLIPSSLVILFRSYVFGRVINKPYLPLASGELTMNTAIIVTALSAIMSLSITLISGSWPLFCGLFAWFLVGTAYSANVLPLLRWKRFPYTAVLYMINSRALAMPFGYYIHVQDIPDIKGDEMHGIKSLASQIGPERMFWSCIWLLGMAYGVSIFVGATSSSTWSRYATVRILKIVLLNGSQNFIFHFQKFSSFHLTFNLVVI
ncbi:putative homogentisate phytyltransferase [Helianthus debilis subsp. tardiflorus]